MSSSNALPKLTGHGKIACACGKIIARCRCIWNDSTHTVTYLTEAECTHRMPPTDIPAPTTFSYLDNIMAHPSRNPRFIIVDSHHDAEYEITDGLAFAIGVCVQEAEITRDVTRMYRVQHPNHVDLYHIAYMPSGQVIVTRVA